MIVLLPLLLALVTLSGAAWTVSAGSPQLARRRATLVAATTFVLSVAAATLISPVTFEFWGGQFEAVPHGLLMIAPVATALVGLIAAGLAPLSTHTQRSFGTILLLIALAHLFISNSNPLASAAAWAGSALVCWYGSGYDARGSHRDRVFALYQTASVTAFACGLGVLWKDPGSSVGIALTLVGIGIREAFVPAHSWFTRFTERTPMGVVVAFAGPQLGVYAQLYLLQVHWLDAGDPKIAFLGAVTAVVAALLGCIQTRARRALAYLFISQTGLVGFGLESSSEVGLAGALLNWQVLAVATSGFAMVLAALEARCGALNMTSPRGAFAQTPRLAVAFLALGLCSVGFPLTLGFVAEELLVQGSVHEHPILAFALIVATALNGITVLRAFFYLFMGRPAEHPGLDMTRRERAIVGTVMFALIGLGCAPHLLLSAEETAIHSR